MDETGSLGSANSDAMVILGLLAMGKDPDQLTSGSGASVVDGMLSYVNTQSGKFQYAGADNALATEQGSAPGGPGGMGRYRTLQYL